ncbi:MAG: sialidase family protein [Rikenellaceae bacterium]
MMPFFLLAQNNSDEERSVTVVETDLTGQVQKGLKLAFKSHSGGYYNHYLVKGYRKLNFIYPIKDSLKIITMEQGNRKNITTMPFPCDFMELDNNEVHFSTLSRRRIDAILATSCSGQFVHSHSLDDGVNWSVPIEREFFTISPSIFNYKRRDNNIVTYFFGKGDLSCGDLEGRSMLFMATSENGGSSWSFPSIALKHNIYSLDNGDMALFFRNEKRKFNDQICVIASDSEHKKTFFSVSSDEGDSFSYPKELVDLRNTSHHVLTIFKHEAALLYIQEDKVTGMYDLWLYNSKVDNISKSERKHRHYKLYSFTKEEIDNGFNYNALLYKRNRLFLTIAKDWEDGARVKYVTMKVKKIIK